MDRLLVIKWIQELLSSTDTSLPPSQCWRIGDSKKCIMASVFREYPMYFQDILKEKPLCTRYHIKCPPWRTGTGRAAGLQKVEDHLGTLGRGSSGRKHMAFQLGRTWWSENKSALHKMLWGLENENDLVRPIWERRVIILTHTAAWIMPFHSVSLALSSTLKFLTLLIFFFLLLKTSEFPEAQQLWVSNVGQKERERNFHIAKRTYIGPPED